MQNITIRNMALTDYDCVIQLWNACDGVHMHRDYSETYEGLENFLNRNPGMSFVALDGEKFIGAILGSHDGRRGFINHLAVIKPFRKHGIARLLVENVIRVLKDEGILKIAIFVLKNNSDGQVFWRKIGFAHEDIVDLYSIKV
jgi:ribosomal protein S18 acetylase RimI-like enzyme